MAGLAVVGGHSILQDGHSDQSGPGPEPRPGFPAGAARRQIQGLAGDVTVLDAIDYLVVQRHGLDTYTPAHRVDHVRNLSAIAAAGCDRVLAISSVGSLRTELAVGTILAPDDFIALDQPATSVHHDARSHIVPGFSTEWRARVLGAWGVQSELAIRDGGVYWQSNGPRFETPAEVRYLALFADVVGMTVASECVIAKELGLEYAAVCVVDNLANGLGSSLLTPEEFAAGKAANATRLHRALHAVALVLAS
jgi:5'-methylthioadenosine phosphorylase